MAMYMVSFDDGRALTVSAPDTKKGFTVARRKAVAKARKGINDVSKPGKTAKPVNVRCIG